MMYESLNEVSRQSERTDRVFSVCSGGVLEATIIAPAGPIRERPLLALHGISRNTAELYDAFVPAAEAAGRMVVIPHFSKEYWPVFQRVSRRTRPDRALLSLFATLRSVCPVLNEPYDIFGFSGGAQLAHRFAMLYPELTGALHLGAAGWYTFPDNRHDYPYGIRDSDDSRNPWGRRMDSGLNVFLQRNITVYVGENDTARDENLRANPELDQQQGRNRVERAKNYVAALRAQQAAFGHAQTARLVLMPGCDHRFIQCAEIGGIAALCCAPA